jgi:hypothetical protein
VKSFYYNIKISFLIPGLEEGAECCGSLINFKNETSPTGAFERISTGPVFYMRKGYAFSRDISPPNRISDIQLFRQEDKELQLELVWTAPGGDYDYGRGESGTKEEHLSFKG